MIAYQCAGGKVVSGTYTKSARDANVKIREEVRCGTRAAAGMSRGISRQIKTHYVLPLHLDTDS